MVLPHGLFTGGFNEMRGDRTASREAARLGLPKPNEKNFPHSCYRFLLILRVLTLLKHSIIETVGECAAMPAKNMGRPNEERKVNTLLKKLQALKAAKKKVA